MFQGCGGFSDKPGKFWANQDKSVTCVTQLNQAVTRETVLEASVLSSTSLTRLSWSATSSPGPRLSARLGSRILYEAFERMDARDRPSPGASESSQLGAKAPRVPGRASAPEPVCTSLRPPRGSRCHGRPAQGQLLAPIAGLAPAASRSPHGHGGGRPSLSLGSPKPSFSPAPVPSPRGLLYCQLLHGLRSQDWRLQGLKERTVSGEQEW